MDRAVAVSVVQAGALMAGLGLVTGTAGNVSVRHGDHIFITPTRRYYSEITPDEIEVIGVEVAEAAVVSVRASREWRMHAAVYQARPDLNAIAHTHSPYAVARSFRREPMAFCTEDGAYLGIAEVPVAPYAPGASTELARSAAQTLGSGRGVLLERHGVVAVGSTARDAVQLAAAIEHEAQVQWLLHGTFPDVTGFRNDTQRSETM